MEQFRLMVFEAVWTTGSYTKAARQMGITQPAVSQNIAELEKELGTALFERGTPTPAAKVFIQMVRKVLKDYDDIRVLFDPEAAEYSKVRIRADRSASEYVLPRVLEPLKATHPAIDFEILAPDNTDDEVDVIITAVASGQQDKVVLRFEVFGSAAPFVEMVRLLLNCVLNS